MHVHVSAHVTTDKNPAGCDSFTVSHCKYENHMSNSTVLHAMPCQSVILFFCSLLITHRADFEIDEWHLLLSSLGITANTLPSDDGYSKRQDRFKTRTQMLIKNAFQWLNYCLKQGLYKYIHWNRVTNIIVINRCQQVVQQQCHLFLNDTLTTRIWQEWVCHLLPRTWQQHGLFPKCLQQKSTLSSRRSKHLFDADVHKVGLPGKNGQITEGDSLFVAALVVRTEHRWHRKHFHQSWECPLSWQELTFNSSYHTVCCSRGWLRSQLGLGPECLSLQEVEEAKSHLVPEQHRVSWNYNLILS